MCVCCTHLFSFFTPAFVLVNDLSLVSRCFLFWKCVRFCFRFCCRLFLFVVCTCILCLLPCHTRCSFIDEELLLKTLQFIIAKEEKKKRIFTSPRKVVNDLLTASDNDKVSILALLDFSATVIIDHTSTLLAFLNRFFLGFSLTRPTAHSPWLVPI